MPTPTPHRSPFGPGFTLVELLVSMTVLIVLVVMVNQLVVSTSATITSSRKHMDADDQARLVFDRLSNDFGRMVKRPDVDYLFYKQDGGSNGVNDKLFFYSESPAYYSTTAGAAPQGSAALVGYRVHNEPDPSDPQHTRVIPRLERLGEGLSWDQATSNDATATTADGTPGGMIFLSTAAGSATPTAATLLAGTSAASGQWSKTIGTVGNNYDDGASVDYHAIGDQVFRLEIAFLLKDGSVSNRPLLSQAPTTWPAGTTFEHDDANADPTPNADSTSYAVGSRWYNLGTSRGFICTSATKGAALWSPIGIQDTSAVIVALAILDSASRATLSDVGVLTKALLDPTSSQLAGSATVPPKLMASVWSDLVNSPGFASTPGLTKAASQVRIYQRYFYLNTP